MRSTFSGFNTLVRGLYAHQMSLDTVGHNVSNASTEGYSRQRVNLVTTMPENLYTGNGRSQIGTGVDIDSITRIRNSFFDKQMWKESSSLGLGKTGQEVLSQIEDIFKDSPPDLGMQTVLNNFWNSWQTLSTNASNDTARKAVRERGAELVDTIQHSRRQLEDMIDNINDTLEVRVQQINQISSEIYDLNVQIRNVEADRHTMANDLRDRRDLLVDKLSQMTNVRVHEDDKHNYIVQVSDVILADGGGCSKLALSPAAASKDPDYGFEVRYVVNTATGRSVNFTNGEMKALQDAGSVTIKGYLDKLTTTSQYLLKEFNAVHRAGYGSDNSTGNDFFGDGLVPMPTTKSEWLDALKVNPTLYNANGLNKIAAKTAKVNAVEQSNKNGGKATVTGAYLPPDLGYRTFQIKVDAIGAGGQVTDISYTTDGGTTWTPAAGAGSFTLPYGLTINITDSAGNLAGDTYTFSVPQGNAIGDNAVLLGNALKSPTVGGSVLKGASLDEYYASMIAGLGVDAEKSKNLYDAQKNMVDQIKNWRESVSGVNMDEELSNMIKFQKGYGAAARIMTAMDEMLDKLINGMGVAGR